MTTMVGKKAEPQVKATALDCAYAAGFIDGEGYIGINAALGRRYSLMVTVCQLVPEPLEWLQARWGGHVTVNAGSAAHRRERPLFYWKTSARQSLELLQEVRPWLQVKATQADVAIAWQLARGRQGRYQTDLDRAAVIAGDQAAHQRLIEIRRAL